MNSLLLLLHHFRVAMHHDCGHPVSDIHRSSAVAHDDIADDGSGNAILDGNTHWFGFVCCSPELDQVPGEQHLFVGLRPDGPDDDEPQVFGAARDEEIAVLDGHGSSGRANAILSRSALQDEVAPK
jgi:hypothetical protein